MRFTIKFIKIWILKSVGVLYRNDVWVDQRSICYDTSVITFPDVISYPYKTAGACNYAKSSVIHLRQWKYRWPWYMVMWLKAHLVSDIKVGLLHGSKCLSQEMTGNDNVLVTRESKQQTGLHRYRKLVLPTSTCRFFFFFFFRPSALLKFRINLGNSEYPSQVKWCSFNQWLCLY
jgi:hypothetical protein